MWIWKHVGKAKSLKASINILELYYESNKQINKSRTLNRHSTQCY